MIEFSDDPGPATPVTDEELMVHLIDPPEPPLMRCRWMALPSPASTLEAYHCTERLYHYVLERYRNSRAGAMHMELRSLADDSRTILQFIGDILQSKFKMDKDDL
jgi:hypothetical protein